MAVSNEISGVSDGWKDCRTAIRNKNGGPGAEPPIFLGGATPFTLLENEGYAHFKEIPHEFKLH